MQLILGKVNQESKKLIFMAHIPISAQQHDIKTAIEKVRFLKIAAERSGYIAYSTDVVTLFESRLHVSKELQQKRERDCHLLSVGTYDAIQYSGSGLSSDHLQDIARAAYFGETPVYLDIPKESLLAQYIIRFKFNRVQRDI
ncbi:MAG: hypothetical protein V4606_04390 [Patescibacteria group bacterium]